MTLVMLLTDKERADLLRWIVREVGLNPNTCDTKDLSAEIEHLVSLDPRWNVDWNTE